MYKYKDRILKATREKDQVTYKSRSIRITADFSKARQAGYSTNSNRPQMPAKITISKQNYRSQYMDKEK